MEWHSLCGIHCCKEEAFKNAEKNYFGKISKQRRNYGNRLLGTNGIVAEGMPIAVGAGVALQLRKETGRVVVCFFGDGALNTGEFHESLNLAGLWKLPVVFVCENNLYAISTSFKRSCAITDISKRAESYGMPGATVDGMDVLAVRKEAKIAIERARNEEGPSLLVCNTYRFLGHGRNPDTRAYRSKEEEREWKARCPVNNFHSKLIREKLITETGDRGRSDRR